jgi:hypothetical protein
MQRKTVIPIPPATKTYGRLVSSGRRKVSLRLLDLDLGSDRELGERAFEGAVAQARAEAEHAALVGRGDDRDVPARPPLVVVGRVEERDPEVLAGREIDFPTEQIEDHEERALRDLALLLDPRVHVSTVTPSWTPGRIPRSSARGG